MSYIAQATWVVVSIYFGIPLKLTRPLKEHQILQKSCFLQIKESSSDQDIPKFSCS